MFFPLSVVSMEEFYLFMNGKFWHCMLYSLYMILFHGGK